ncbi:helix-turn-helix domain-containing protein [Kordia sp.]|uniref:helix-turn-helix domain-containing protein n=1 Tax=Kordia sp. TaxID=1965332 RepID=UPI003D6C3131
MKKILIYTCLFLVSMFASAQEKDPFSDEFEAIRVKMRDTSISSAQKQEFFNQYWIKAKKSNQNINIGRAYYLKTLVTKDIDEQFQYLDTVIFYTKNIKGDDLFPMQAHTHKGRLHFYQKDYVKSLNAQIEAKHAAESRNHIKYQRSIKYNIGLLKRILGLYEEAEILFLECKEFEENREEKHLETYVNILFQLSSVYFELGKIEKSQEINSQAIKLTKDSDLNIYYYYSFVSNEGMNLNAEGNYKASIDSLEKAYTYLNEADKNVANFYLGKSYYELGNKKKGIDYFKKIDTVFKATNDLFPSISPAYVYLINDSKEKKDKDLQLYYTNQLLKVDTIINKNYRSLSKNITKKYDVPRLMEERDDIIVELEEKNRKGDEEKKWILKISITVCFLAIGLFLYYYRLKRVYEKRYQSIIETIKEPIIEEIRVEDTNLLPAPSLNIDQTIIEETLQSLDEFEKGEAYLTNQISLKDVAKIVNTNSKYLSKIINTYKKKNFITYINDLRIDYFVRNIQTDTKYQKYTIRAIAEEIGFSNPEGFSRAFQKKTGLKPSYFIKKARQNATKKQ